MSGTRKSGLFGKITVIVIVGCCCLSAQGKYGGGSGEPNDPYQIRDANHMQSIGADANDWDKHFLLCADIDLSTFTGTEFNIIGTSDSNAFTGIFDGNDHTISNFTYDSIHSRDVGLFGCVKGASAAIKNLGLINANVCARHTMDFSVGSLIGRLDNGTVENCYANGGSVRGFPFVSNFAYVGGLVGFCFTGSEITSCYAAGSAQAYALKGTCDADVGGLVGRLLSSRITDSYATGSVFGAAAQSGSNIIVGGLVGRFYLVAEIMNSYAAGKVEAITDDVADANTGGLVGYRDVTTNLTSSFWDTQTSGQSNGVGYGSSTGVSGKTTAEMMQQATFDPPWDFLGNWGIIENETYPLLRAINFCAQTSYPPADLNKDCRIDFYDFAITALSWLEDKNW